MKYIIGCLKYLNLNFSNMWAFTIHCAILCKHRSKYKSSAIIACLIHNVQHFLLHFSMDWYVYQIPYHSFEWVWLLILDIFNAGTGILVGKRRPNYYNFLIWFIFHLTIGEFCPVSITCRCSITSPSSIMSRHLAVIFFCVTRLSYFCLVWVKIFSNVSSGVDVAKCH